MNRKKILITESFSLEILESNINNIVKIKQIFYYGRSIIFAFSGLRCKLIIKKTQQNTHSLVPLRLLETFRVSSLLQDLYDNTLELLLLNGVVTRNFCFVSRYVMHQFGLSD